MRSNVGRGAPSGGGPVEYYSVRVGRPHPYLAPPPGGAGGQAAGLATGQLNVDMFYTAPIEWEVAALGGTWAACGLHLTRELLTALFVFQGQGGQWLVAAPVIATEDDVRDWAAADSNAANFYLMEAGTGVVRQIRHVGLDPDFMAWMKGALRVVPHPGDPAHYGRLLQQDGLKGLWQGAKKWLWDPRRGAFQRAF